MRSKKQVRQDARDLYRACLVDGLLDEKHVRQVVSDLSGSTVRERFALLGEFARLVRLDRQRHTASIESATPLPADLLSGVTAELNQQYGPGLSISVEQRPELIGGMRVRVGSHVYDGTMQGRLAALEARF